jgi:DNA polymerase III epsilon subunit family exonuclease
MSVPGPIVGKVTTFSSVPAARSEAPCETRDPALDQAPGEVSHQAPGDGQRQAPGGEGAQPPGELAVEPCLYLEQGALDGLSRPLAETEFVIFDLETTGGSPAHAAITEIGAVRTGGAAGTREFATLVNPGRPIPPHVADLTGISDAAVTTAPRIEEALPRFIEFARGCVLVAHNAPFDVSFLRAACTRHNLTWPALPTLDTAALARRMLTTDEVHDCRLATLAGFFGATTRPTHRALDDARATTAVLHALLDRLARHGVHTLEALRGFGLPPAPQRRRMRLLTAAIPHAPGVCLFTAADGHVLHVVRSSDMHARASGYFTAAETRDGIREMIGKTARIVPIRCATTLEAQVAEIRLTAVHLPDGTQPRPSGAEDTGDDGAGGVRPRRAGLRALASVRRLVAARPRFSGGWDVAWIAHGLLEATAVLPRGARATAGAVADGTAVPCVTGPGAQAAAGGAETACLLDWLESSGVRLIEVHGTWSVPVPR